MNLRLAGLCAVALVVPSVLMLEGPARLGGPVGIAAASQSDAATNAGCDLEAYARSEAEFNRMAELKRVDPDAITQSEYRVAAADFVRRGEECFDALYGDEDQVRIDDGGLWHTEDGSQPYRTWGTKWGAGSPFSGGVNVPGPGIPGGTVTYSFMNNGVSYDESFIGPPFGVGTMTAITSLPNFQACFLTEIRNAIAAWSAVANIQFTEVADNGVAFNGSGAVGDIRIGAHTFDGQFNILAHCYFPPPNGTTSAGDAHFDASENWSCTPSGGFDIGIVAAHEFGHGIGLHHEETLTALMNPFYNSSILGPIADDINGAASIYGPAPASTGRRLVVDFGSSYGTWILNYGVSWTQLHSLSPQEIAIGDLDNNGVDEIVLDFGPSAGVWVRMNNTSWSQLHPLSPVAMGIADMDGNGLDDLILSFTTHGVYVRYNNSTWTLLHGTTATKIAAGQLDGSSGEDVVLNFPGLGIWQRMNNSSWVALHGLNSTVIATGNISGASIDEVVVDFASAGLWYRRDNATWHQLSAATASNLGTGNIDGNAMKELVANFGTTHGTWLARNAGALTKLHGLRAENIAIGDLNGNGGGDIVLDFGGVGVWVYLDDSSWVQAHGLNPDEIATADLS